jgi:type IV secretion system protein VirB1
MGPLPRWSITPARISSRRNAKGVAIAVLAAAALVISAPAYATSLSVNEFAQLALRCAPSVAPSTLSAIARTESDFQPLSINDNTARTSSAPATRESAIQIASKLLDAGHSLDVGIMQVNSANFAMLGLTLEAAFDPCKSVAAGAAVLVGGYAGGTTHEGQQAALRVALSKYNTGDASRGFANGYVHKVELAAAYVVPALDVGAGPAAIDSPPPIPVAAPSAPSPPADPNAPPSWDVWSSFDYAATHHRNTPAPAQAAPGPGSAVLATGGTEPQPAVAVSAPTVER